MSKVKDLVLSLIKDKTGKVTARLTEAKVRFANAHLNEDDWAVRGAHEKTCQIFKGQLEILEEVAKQIIELA